MHDLFDEMDKFYVLQMYMRLQLVGWFVKYKTGRYNYYMYDLINIIYFHNFQEFLFIGIFDQ